MLAVGREGRFHFPTPWGARLQPVAHPSGSLACFEVKWYSPFVFNGLQGRQWLASEGELLLSYVPYEVGQISEPTS